MRWIRKKHKKIRRHSCYVERLCYLEVKFHLYHKRSKLLPHLRRCREIFWHLLSAWPRINNVDVAKRWSHWGAWFLWVPLPLTALVLETEISPRNRHFRGQRYFEDFFSLFFPFLVHQWRWKVISNFRLCKKRNVTLTVDFQGQGYLSEFFQYFFRIQSIKLRRKTLWNPRFY